MLEDLEPKSLWSHFYNITKIPRCSKNEGKMREYILDFAKKEGLQFKTDDAGNIVVLKPASPGMKNKPVVILQGHIDMVCEKNRDVEHDFSKDPIKLKREGDILSAEGTTLGADDGIGVAAILSILEDKALEHGPIEALFTVDEETGLTGAFDLKSDMLSGEIMLNLDSEDFGILTIGCAGGGDTVLELPIKMESLDKNLESISVKVEGLRGGHSGIDIHEQRGNAIKILARLLWKTRNGFHLADIKGGDKRNAIPREAAAKVSVVDKDKFISNIREEEKSIYEEIKTVDPKFKVEIEDINTLEEGLDKGSQERLINLLHGLPHGVSRMSYEMPGLVETSNNLATVAIKQGKAVIGLSSRSAVKTALQDMRDRIKAIATLAGAKVIEERPYPGWKPDLKSRILSLSKRVYKDMYGEEPKVEAVHAGLECGIIGEKFPKIDMISIGPTIRYPHSPEEQLKISTVEKFYNYIVGILKNI